MLPDATSQSYGFYPRLMIRLSAASYLDMSQIPKAVHNLGQKVVWGPAELVDSTGTSYSSAFICRRSQPDEYTLVIRGTEETSLWSWLSEDLDVGTTQPLNKLVPVAPAAALISQATADGMQDLLNLTDPTTGKGFVEFLTDTQPQTLYITGHSLGGTLTPPMFTLLNGVLNGGRFTKGMALWSFAGLTPGNAAFNQYFNSLFNPQFPWRLHNSLDIAPFCWTSVKDVADIYAPYDLSWGEPESGLITGLFDLAKRVGYAQPMGDQPLAGRFATGWDAWFWALQAIFQHHTSTYTTLVDAAYPTRQELQQARGVSLSLA